jgi:hypothetical protein
MYPNGTIVATTSVTAPSFIGNLTGNATTATTATSAASANMVNSPDGDRNANTKLPTTTPLGVRFDFVNASSVGTSGNYAGLMTYAPWLGTTASTGDASYQLAFGSTQTNGGGIPMLNIRKGIDTTWNSWYTILHSGNVGAYIAGSLALQSGRDFPLGTLIQTDIDYSVSSGEPWLIEIEGNSYGSAIPFDLKYQGYIYSNTIINHGGVSNGTNITGMSVFNYNGKLTFWFPNQAYWQGFTVQVNDSYAGSKKNRVSTITNAAKP